MVSNYGTGGESARRGMRTGDEPAATITGKIGRAKVVAVETGQNSRKTRRGKTEKYRKPVDQPSPTVTGQAGSWVLLGAGATSESTAGQRPRELCEPAHTITGSQTAVWKERPATTIVGDPGRFEKGGAPRQDRPGTVNVSPEEAAILQSYPPDFVWVGNKGDRYQQIGNAVPPLLAEAILREFLEPAESTAAHYEIEPFDIGAIA